MIPSVDSSDRVKCYVNLINVAFHSHLAKLGIDTIHGVCYNCDIMNQCGIGPHI